MKKPTPEEVKEYFKDAELLKEQKTGFEFKCDLNKIYKSSFGNYCIDIDGATIYVWSKEIGFKGYAEIITYKNNNIMKSDLSNVKVGDSIWTIQEGWTEVKRIDNDVLPIKTKNNSYNFNGTHMSKDKHPSAFLTNPFEGIVKKYRVGQNNTLLDIKKGVVLNGKFYVESGWTDWAEIIQQPIEVTLEEIAEKFNVDVKLLKIKK